MFDLTGKTALITGGSKGIGLAMAEALGKQGANIVITGRGKEALFAAKEQLGFAGIRAEAVQSDVTDRASIESAVGQAVEQFGSLDILVNNAGMNIRKPLVEVEEEDWDRVVDTNLKGIFLAGQAAARQMIRQKRGKIINISSVYGLIGGPNQTSYAASKGGINQLTRVWAEELAEHGIHVNAIAPGYIQTPMTAAFLEDKERTRKLVGHTMLGRLGDLDDLAGPVVLLASDASDYITGQIISVDGGWSAR
ncbi:2-deoxy-D-gluconate 3-dehydrogenase [Bhargavaea cecembensis]|uniref:2-deoxy-D-gluconate 3-dehydrogenase n=1 Tax=Bhargavaea cecembensis TaxID=394098 RepID=A0A161RG51_9BACL|nr:glucose 1-dehydrogenase [Bhargavaea cecembensis]KZE38962.1 2-deoxy-D-gluconate 3-dehydrogenase [Bhargavaea cecembensis]